MVPPVVSVHSLERFRCKAHTVIPEACRPNSLELLAPDAIMSRQSKVMNGTVLFGIVLLPALVLALAYYPILERLSVALISPYPKADVGRRVSAATVDGLL